MSSTSNRFGGGGYMNVRTEDCSSVANACKMFCLECLQELGTRVWVVNVERGDLHM